MENVIPEVDYSVCESIAVTEKPQFEMPSIYDGENERKSFKATSCTYAKGSIEEQIFG